MLCVGDKVFVRDIIPYDSDQSKKRFSLCNAFVEEVDDNRRFPYLLTFESMTLNEINHYHWRDEELIFVDGPKSDIKVVSEEELKDFFTK